MSKVDCEKKIDEILKKVCKIEKKIENLALTTNLKIKDSDSVQVKSFVS